MLNEPVHIAEYSANWPALFTSEQNRLATNLGAFPEQIVHIGSTAVPGLAAKPIIDIVFGVDAYPPSDTMIKQIVDLGYEALGEAGVTGRFYFRRRDEVSCNLHVVQRQGPHWISNIALRDYLCANKSARDRYVAAKRAAIAAGATDLLSYSEQKANTIAQLLAESVVHQCSNAAEIKGETVDKLPNVQEELAAREPIFHRTEFGATRAAFDAMMADEFWEVGASGQRYNRTQILDALEQRYSTPHADEWKTEDFHCQLLATDNYLLTYTLHQGSRITRRSTIWRLTPQGWVIVYHQGTIVETQ